MFKIVLLLSLAMTGVLANNVLKIGAKWSGEEPLLSMDAAYSLQLKDGKLELMQANTNSKIWTSDNKAKGQMLWLRANGDLELVASDEETVVWKADPKSNCSFIKELTVSNSGSVKLVCGDNSVIWEAPEGKAPKSSSSLSEPKSSKPSSCVFQHSQGVAPSISQLIFRRCREMYSSQVIETQVGPRHLVDDRGCGVLDANDEDTANNNDLCYQKHAITTSFVVSTWLTGLAFDSTSMALPQMPAFLNLKHELEHLWMRHIERNSRVYETLHVERFTLFGLDLAQDNRTTMASLLLQLRRKVSREEVQDSLDQILAMPRVKHVLGTHRVSVEVLEPPSCDSPLTLFNQSELMDTGMELVAPENNEQVDMGVGVDLVCKERELRPEFDDDNYEKDDGIFTVVCSAIQEYQVPRVWPKCVRTCGLSLPAPPAKTGLVALRPKGPVPIGQNAQYICMDEELGVEQGGTALFNVSCKSDLTYDVPALDELWPVCRVRTTTIHPAILKGVDVVMSRALGELKERILSDPSPRGWGDLDEDESGFFSKQDWYRLEIITLPSAVGLLVGVLVLCACVSNPKSCCCLMFAAEQPSTKLIVPLDKQGNLEVEHYQRLQ